MKLSVIVPTYNAGEFLEELLSSLKTQSILHELIIIDSSSTDETPQIAKAHADIFLSIPNNSFDHGGTRTKAAKLAKGDILVFLTQDAIPFNENTFKNLLDAFTNQNVSAAYGRQIPYAKTSYFGKHAREFNYPKVSCIKSLSDKEKLGIKTAFLSNSFAAYKKSTMQEVGWFKDGLIVGEDAYMGAKLLLSGYNIAYSAKAKVYHSHSYTFMEEVKRYFDIGVFHKREYWLLEFFGKAEGEGFRFVKSELSYLVKQKAFLLLPIAVLRTIGKYVLYKLGQKYESLPRWFIIKCSMHSHWWSKSEGI